MPTQCQQTACQGGVGNLSVLLENIVVLHTAQTVGAGYLLIMAHPAVLQYTMNPYSNPSAFSIQCNPDISNLQMRGKMFDIHKCSQQIAKVRPFA